ncbi:MAG TPA: immunoglobulin-like domain-containing protein [Chitinophagaceae bacterium]
MKIISIFISVFILGSLFSCNKTDFNYPAGTVGESKIVFFAAINTNGDKIVAVNEGTGYTDPGATATLNGAAAQYTTSKVIDASTAPGVYTINYTASNPQGFKANDFRIVVVIPSAMVNDPTVQSNDFSGTYLRAATGITSTWTKIGIGTYAVENPGGAGGGAGLPVIVENTSGNAITIPDQQSPYFGSEVSSSGESYDPTPPATYSWIFLASGYGTGVRTFVKQ